ncbi:MULTISPECIES: NADH:ubiquinone reductase (Na(+)-transporting) subunit D [Halobacteriovorax]|uniref:Na(+)-translocating NADH-quinone reductase subunit D n=1 Tax=Halobacteriovorax vibrionivorans TaxID=2152716 RepID=A0ABY0IH04_9BACT|nr:MULTISPECIES: NADH:ubiquinone reductase (Na(+)-transporting) subunit D [Halobacteriovorax]AYF45058.1 NADH:ubiquinone oxidoreductase, D subunit [Halobacteriovorax sp. BALOs_7]RZF21121.1 NADH:ubiquinone reductase (Na(+)-transporting) subunit D [Halobacteriovorax vibrionivorans]TGD46282.1 NADH:ubiquinone reductase (Na(+)-transporting) subunit D [Halobacteriovorax sp. Y22]
MKLKETVLNPLFENNPIALQILGICSALAVTTKMESVAVMCLAVTLVCAFANLFVSLIRNHVPSAIRIIVMMTIIASLVIVTDQLLKAYVYDVAKSMSVYIGLIITNCIVMGRAEAYAMKNPPIMSFFDGIGNGIGYSIVLVFVGFFRELLGSGKLFGVSILATTGEGGWYQTNGMALLAPSAFFLIGFFIWGLRTWKKDQIEEM